MRWFRLYSEARTDAKLESLPDDEFRVWHRLLCFANDQPTRGTIAGFSPRLLAVEVARGDVALLERTLISLADLRIIETGETGHHFTHWESRQYASDNVYARVQKHREAQKKQNETLQKRFSNVSVTPPDTDTDTDTDHHDPKVDPDPFAAASDDARRTGAGAVIDISLVAPSGASATPSGKPRRPRTPRPQPTDHKAAPPAPLHAKPARVNPWWDALSEEFPAYAPTTSNEHSNWGKVVGQIRKAGGTAEDIRARCANHRRLLEMGLIAWTLTPNALPNHWTELGNADALIAASRNGTSRARAAPVTGAPSSGEVKLSALRDLSREPEGA